eukprot:c3993_g1_i1.p1 GENE.c3993_g1_i1~~c3993_g1_i1.p1  ORF type:complete len:123 (+),score=7.38 c3993_g1_i1:63-431(+)
MTDPIHINDMAHFKKVCQENVGKLIVIDFTATWCGPCQRIAPAYKAMSHELTSVVFLKVDVDDVADVTNAFGVRSMPTFYFLKIKDASYDPSTAPKDESKVTISSFSGADENKLKATVKSLM